MFSKFHTVAQSYTWKNFHESGSMNPTPRGQSQTHPQPHSRSQLILLHSHTLQMTHHLPKRQSQGSLARLCSRFSFTLHFLVTIAS